VIIRFHLISGEFIQTNHGTQEILDEVRRLLAEPNAIIQIPDDDDLYRAEYGGDDQQADPEFRKYTLIPVRAITHVKKL
jgi:hypothetical protein